MDIQQLENILLHTYSTDNNLRKAAEDAVSQLPQVPQALNLLLQLVNNATTQREIKQAAAIATKNLVQKQWIHDASQPSVDGLVGFPENDKQLYRPMILQALFNEQDSSLRSILAECVHLVARLDFPTKWPSLVDDISQAIHSHEPQRMYNALIALRKLVKVFEYKSGEERKPLDAIVMVIFPLLRSLFEQLLSNTASLPANSDTAVQSAQMLHIMCKVFWSCVQFNLPPFLSTAPLQEIQSWMELFKPLLGKQLPAEVQPADLDERKHFPWWKCKKWILQILCRLQSRWGNPKQVEDHQAELATFLRTHVCPNMLGTVFELLALRPQGQYCLDRVIQLCLSWTSNAIEPSATYKLIKPHLPFLLFQVIHPLLCLTPADLELWQEDPHEFVRKAHDIFEDFFDPVMAAAGLLTDLSRKRGKDCMNQILQFYNNLLNQYSSKPVAERTFEDYIQKDASLHALFALSSTLTGPKSAYKDMIEGMIQEQVLPEFQSPHGFLRLRACRMFSKHFIDAVVYKDENTLRAVLEGVLKCMKDPELPVKIEAAKSLRTLVCYKHSGVILDGLRPILPQVLEQYFELMDEIGNDEVVCALETIIDAFGDEIGPFAGQLVTKLIECFQQFAGVGDDDDDAAMAAMQCLDAINTILISIHAHPELYDVVTAPLLPILTPIFTSEEGIEYLDSALDILSSITFYGTTVSPTMWQLFPLLFQCFETYGWDYLSNIVPVVDNYVGRDVEGFCSGRHGEHSYIEMVFLMIKKILENDVADEVELICCCRLLSSILHNCFGQVDLWVPTMISMVLQGLSKAVTPAAQNNFLSVVASLFYYNPSATLETLEKVNATEKLFNIWMNNCLERAESMFEKKLLSLGLTSLLRVPVAQMPASVRTNLQGIIFQTGQVLRAMLEQENQQSKPKNENEEDPSAAALIPDGGYDSGEDAEGIEDDEYLQVLRELQSEAQMGSNFIYDLEDDDDDYSSGLDLVEPVALFVESFKAASTNDPQTFGPIQQELGPSFGALFEAFTTEATRRQEAAAAAKQATS